MELLPTREEHITLEREKYDADIRLKASTTKISDFEHKISTLESELKLRDERLGELSNAGQNLRERLCETTNALEIERAKKLEISREVTSEERKRYQATLKENARLKHDL